MPETRVSPSVSTPISIPYGDDPSQFGELWPTSAASAPVAVLIHGGFWRATYGLDLMDAMARDLVSRGFAVWNIEYRRVGQTGGGYPGTLDDVAAAIDHLATIAAEYRLDMTNVSVVGHSAGGHLALWSAGRTGAAVTPRVAVGLGAVVDLELAAEQRLGSGAVIELLGGAPDDVPERYAAAAPLAAIDGVELISVRAAGDDIVPAEFTVPARANEYETIDVEGDHFTLIDPTAASWAEVVSRLG